MSEIDRRPEVFVEPLSDLAWARIERGLFQALDEERAPAPPAPRVKRRWPALAAGTGVAVAAGILLLIALRGGGGGPAPGTETARVATEEAPSHFAVGDADLTVAPQSAILVDRNHEGTVRVILERGRVSLQVAPRGDRPPLSVLAGDVRVEVVGTKFAVTRLGDRARVEVDEGVVRVLAEGESTKVHAGEVWGPEEERPDRSAESETAEGETAEVEDADAGGPAAEPGRAAAPEREAETGSRRTAQAPERRADRAEPEDEGEAEPEAPSARERFLRAARLEARDPSAAAGLYREIERAGGPWAAPALFARARLELERDRRDRARRLLDRYLERYPEGTNAADARELLDRLN